MRKTRIERNFERLQVVNNLTKAKLTKARQEGQKFKEQRDSLYKVVGKLRSKIVELEKAYDDLNAENDNLRMELNEAHDQAEYLEDLINERGLADDRDYERY